MAHSLFRRCIRRICSSSRLKPSSSPSLSSRLILHQAEPRFTPSRPPVAFDLSNPWWIFKNFSHGSVNLVISQGKPKFETHEIDPLKKKKWQTKKRLKLQRKREKQKRKSANKRDPRRLGVKGKKRKQKFANAEERIKYKIEKARIKENLLIERLKRYEVQKLQGPAVKQDELTGEERFYMKKMAQKGSNYVPVGRRGVFGGVILNMHMHWKKHETVKVICKPCKPGQVQEYANDIARLSGGIPIQIIGDDTIIFYRGKNYVQPKVMSPIDTLSKKRALEKSKYEQSLESVRRFIAIAEKELELYYRHIALYGDPNNRDPNVILDGPIKCTHKHENVEMSKNEYLSSAANGIFGDMSETENDSTEEPSEEEDDDEDGDISGKELDSLDDGTDDSYSSLSSSMQESSCMYKSVGHFDRKEFVKDFESEKLI
ncbi:hypothetical protein LguiA_029361 [Lonicera macranthoides]